MNSIQQKLIDEFTVSVSSADFSQKHNCYSSYKKFLCLWNFPYCEETTNITLPVCKQYCENFMNNCGSTVDRCETEFSSEPGLEQDSESCTITQDL